MKKQTSLFLILLIVWTACVPSSRYEQSLNQSEVNRGELERVVAHYDSLDNTKKRRAAIFLIENMTDKQSIVIHDSTAYYDLLRCLSTVNDPIGWDPAFSVVHKSIDSILLVFPQRITMSRDLQTIKADYLINNIDSAFHVWNNVSWSKNYTFEEFCQYVLPYKLDSEELEGWRELVLCHKASAEDSLLQKKASPWEMAVLLINNTEFHYNIGMGRFPYPMNLSDLNLIKMGTCDHMANLALYYFRSRGIPSAIDLLPAWANRSSSHTWNVVILPNKKVRSIGYQSNGINRLAYKVSKIYRKMYEVQPLPALTDNEVLPPFFAQGDHCCPIKIQNSSLK